MKNHLVFYFVFLASATLAQRNFKCTKTLSGTHTEVQNLRFSPNGKILATAGVDGKIAFWDTYTGKLIKSFNAHSGRVTEVTFSHSGEYLASAGQDGGAKVWKVPSGELVTSYVNPPHPLEKKLTYSDNSFICFSADDKKIFFGGANGMVHSAGAITKTGLTRVFGDDDFFLGTITGGCLTSDKKYLAVSLNHHIIVIDLATNDLYRQMTYEADFLNDVVVGPDPNTLAGWSTDGFVTIWDHLSGERLESYRVLPVGKREYSGATFSRDGKLMATGANANLITVWDISGRNYQKVAQLGDHSKLVRICRFSPTENILASASYDGTVKIWADEEVIKKVEKAQKEEAVKEEKKPEPKKAEISDTPPSPTKPIALDTLKPGVKITLNVLFEQSKAELLPESYPALDRVAEEMLKNKKIRIELQGHTDSTGLPVHNIRLSGERAMVCRNYLISKGVEPHRIEISAHGGSKPIADNSTPEGRRKNRRVELVVLEY